MIFLFFVILMTSNSSGLKPLASLVPTSEGCPGLAVAPPCRLDCKSYDTIGSHLQRGELWTSFVQADHWCTQGIVTDLEQSPEAPWMLLEPSPTSLLLLPLVGFCWLERTQSKTTSDHECHSDVASRPVACVALCRMPWKSLGGRRRFGCCHRFLLQGPGWWVLTGIRRIEICGIHDACRIGYWLGQRTAWWNYGWCFLGPYSILKWETLGGSLMICSCLPSWILVWLWLCSSLMVFCPGVMRLGRQVWVPVWFVLSSPAVDGWAVRLARSPGHALGSQ